MTRLTFHPPMLASTKRGVPWSNCRPCPKGSSHVPPNDAMSRLRVGLPGSILLERGKIIVIDLALRIGVRVAAKESQSDAIALANSHSELLEPRAAVVLVIRNVQSAVLRIRRHKRAQVHITLVAERPGELVRRQELIERICDGLVDRSLVRISDVRINLVDIPRGRAIERVETVSHVRDQAERYLTLERNIEPIQKLPRTIVREPGQRIAEPCIWSKALPNTG